MKNQNEPYTITIRELVYIARALGADNYRQILTQAALSHYEGHACLAATDTHRLHVLRLGPCEPFENKTIDVKRILHEARFHKANEIQLLRDFSEVLLVARKGRYAPTHPVYAPVFDTVQGPYPNWQRVIPANLEVAKELFAIDPRYLADATLLAKPEYRITVEMENRNRPAVFRHPGSDRWLSLVMPKALE